MHHKVTKLQQSKGSGGDWVRDLSFRAISVRYPHINNWVWQQLKNYTYTKCSNSSRPCLTLVEMPQKLFWLAEQNRQNIDVKVNIIQNKETTAKSNISTNIAKWQFPSVESWNVYCTTQLEHKKACRKFIKITSHCQNCRIQLQKYFESLH